jgi:hypothetical protein
MTFGVLGNHLHLEAEPPHPRPPQIIHYPLSDQRSRPPSGLRGSGGLTSISTSTRSMRLRGHLRLDAGPPHPGPKAGREVLPGEEWHGGGASSRLSWTKMVDLHF